MSNAPVPAAAPGLPSTASPKPKRREARPSRRARAPVELTPTQAAFNASLLPRGTLFERMSCHPQVAGQSPPSTPRDFVEAAVARLIDMLDRLDGDPDLEPAVGGGNHGEPLDLEGDAADAEPWLGAPIGTGDQELWAQGDPHDAELTGLAEFDLDNPWCPLERAEAERALVRAAERELRNIVNRLSGGQK